MSLILKLAFPIAVALGLIILWHLPPENLDYNRLETLLASGNWQQADRETREILIILATKENAFRRALHISIDSPFYSSKLLNEIHCKDLLAIDQLWVKYSQRKFGFSVQQSIWNSLSVAEAKHPSSQYLDDRLRHIYLAFAFHIGWTTNPKSISYDYNSLNFSLKAPEGHLPSLLWTAEDKNGKPLRHDEL